MKKKILFVFTLPPPTHGSNIINQYVSKFYFNNFAQSDIFPLRYTESIAEIGVFNSKKILLLIKYLYTLHKKIKKFSPEYVYFVPAITGLSFLRDCIFIQLFRLYRVKIILHLHGKGVKAKTKNLIWRLIYKWFFKNTIIIHLSKKLLYDLEHVVNIEDIYILPNGVEPSSNKSVYQRNYKKNSENNLTLLFLSNFIKSKGIIDFLKACAILKNQTNNFNILLVGNYSKTISKQFLSKLITNLSLEDNILHIGPAYGMEKKRLLSTSDIFVFPSFYEKECFPLVVLEAMSMQLPIIATNEGAISEIIDHEITGFIVDKRDVNDIANKILNLLEYQEVRQLMASNAYEKYKHNYTLQIFEQNFKAIICSIMSN